MRRRTGYYSGNISDFYSEVPSLNLAKKPIILIFS
jgi:hypothetical protein